MKKEILTFAILLAFSIVHGQNSDWVQLSPPVTNKALQDIALVGPSVIIAVGDNGTIIKSSDGGDTWENKLSPTSERLYAVDFVNSTTGFVVGAGGTILKTTDSGYTWIKQISGTSNSLFSVQFASPDTGWISGYNRIILKTTDGGSTWTSQYSESALIFLEELSVINKTIAHAAGWGSSGSFYSTSDGGQNWAGQNLGTSWAKSVYFINETSGWLAGITASYISVTSDPFMGTSVTVTGKKATVWKSVNGGNVWVPYVTAYDKWLNDITFINSEKGWSVGENGLIISTIDGGVTWNNQTNPLFSAVTLNAVAFESSNTGYIVGDKGTILKTVDSGATWSPRANKGTTKDLSSVYFVTAGTGWVTGKDGTVMKTSDGGKNWITQSSGTTEYIISGFFADINTGWCTGSAGVILSTSDGGEVWTKQASGVTTSLNSVIFTDKTNGWITGSEGVILHTTNGGTTWLKVPSGVTNSLHSVFFSGNMTGWIACDLGMILKTIDGGMNWNTIQAAERSYYNNLNDIFFINEMTGWCVSDYSIRKTIDGGNTWTEQFSSMGEYYSYYGHNSIFFIDENTGWITSNGGKVIKTSDGGTTWGINSTGTLYTLNDILFFTNLTGYAIGDGGNIRMTGNGGGNFTPMENLGIPIPVEPADRSQNISGEPLLKWKPAAVGSQYELLLTTSGVYEYDSVIFDISSITDTFRLLKDLKQETTYYWKVRSTGTNDVKGNWSKKVEFRTTRSPFCIPALYPTWDFRISGKYEVNLEWNCGDADSYRVQISTDETFSKITLADSVVFSLKILAKLNYDSTYYWRVAGIRGSFEGEWSAYGTITTGAEPFITFEYPDENSILFKGDNYFIKWFDNLDSFLWVYLYKGSEELERIGQTSSMNLLWNVPFVLENGSILKDGSDYRILIEDPVNDIYNFSKFFSILNLTPVPEMTAGESGCIIYPNPANGKFIVEFTRPANELADISLFGPDGMLIMKKRLPLAVNEIDVSSITYGIYLAEIRQGQTCYFKKIIIK